MTTKRTLATMKRNFEQEIDIENQRCTLKVVRSDWEPPEVFHVDLGKLPPDMQTEFMAIRPHATRSRGNGPAGHALLAGPGRH